METLVSAYVGAWVATTAYLAWLTMQHAIWMDRQKELLQSRDRDAEEY